jgi:hypothetical protein
LSRVRSQAKNVPLCHALPIRTTPH